MPALENVSYLCLHIYCLCDILVPAMASLFRGIPSLTTLAITSIWPDLDVSKKNLMSYIYSSLENCKSFGLAFVELFQV